MEKEKWPIAFAVMEVKKRGGWSDGYRDIILGYIVSKCYIVQSTIKYGDRKISHEIVFPYENVVCPDKEHYWDFYDTVWPLGERITPQTSSKSYFAEDLYESYEEAKKIAEYKNEHFKAMISLYIDSLKGKKEELELRLEKEKLQLLDLCLKYEELIALNTTDMIVSEGFCEELPKILKMKDSI